MKELLEGVHICPRDGQFAWRVVVLKGHMENIFGRRSNLQANVKRVTCMPYGYIIEVECPKCGKRFFVDHKSNT